ncbi:hypothetical protein EVAR_44009_1 [Eumeta japonica]|uniref:Uncharacterized protein n=1 Tax=Eumeta variegata TaxID=151549 RepID=A0A4C1XDM9_EUMVA|nr:hypothetical protein EVAR_44009_1 [Eumeta japonica]
MRHLQQCGSTKKPFKELRTNYSWIKGLKSQDKEIYKRCDIVNTATEFYRKLYSDNNNNITTSNNNKEDQFKDFIEIDETEVIETIKKLKLDKSPGSNSVTNEALKAGPSILATPLTKLFNLILLNCETPTQWAGHVVRYTDRRWTARVTLWNGPTGKRSRGRPSTRWEDDLRRIAGPNWTDIARDRDVWASLEEAFTQSGCLVTRCAHSNRRHPESAGVGDRREFARVRAVNDRTRGFRDFYRFIAEAGALTSFHFKPSAFIALTLLAGPVQGGLWTNAVNVRLHYRDRCLFEFFEIQNV